MSETDEETVVLNRATNTVHKPRGRGTRPACQERLQTDEFGHCSLAFRYSISDDDWAECGHPECFGGDDGS